MSTHNLYTTQMATEEEEEEEEEEYQTLSEYISDFCEFAFLTRI